MCVLLCQVRSSCRFAPLKGHDGANICHVRDRALRLSQVVAFFSHGFANKFTIRICHSLKCTYIIKRILKCTELLYKLIDSRSTKE